MKATIHWNQGVSFIAESGTGHRITLDGPPESGGNNLGPRPMELLLMGTGGCTAYDVMHILKKARQDVTNCYVTIDAARAETDPKVFTHIHFHFVITGRDVQRSHVERAIQLSKDKYCSASIMLGKTAEITADFELVFEPASAPTDSTDTITTG